MKKVLQLKYSFDETFQIFSLSGIANLNLPFHSQFCNTPKKMSSVKRRVSQNHFDFDIINVGQVNEGFESEQTIDGNDEGKKQFFLS